MMKQNFQRNYWRYLHILIFSSILLSHTASASEQMPSKWLLGDKTQCIMAPQNFSCCVSKQKVIIKKGNKIVINYDFKKPVVCAVSNPLFSCIAVFVSTQKDIEFWEECNKDSKYYTPPEYIAEALYFINIPKRTVKRWSPKGELFFSDWSFDIWSKGGNYVALLQDHMGPIFVYRAKDFIESVGMDPHFVIYGSEPDSTDPAMVTKFMEWKTDTVLIYRRGCCGDEFIQESDILTGKGSTLQSYKVH